MIVIFGTSGIAICTAVFVPLTDTDKNRQSQSTRLYHGDVIDQIESNQ